MKSKSELKIVPKKKSNDFVGIKIDNNLIEIHVPQVFRENRNNNERNRELLLFLRSISIAKTVNASAIREKDNDELGEIWPIDSYLWIFYDYIKNGYYYTREKVFSHIYNGKIDWKRTLRTVPIYSDQNLIYNNIVTSKMSANNDIIAQIYKICLSVSLSRIGWAFNYEFYVDVQQVKSNKEMIYILYKELQSTFDDVKRLRFKCLLDILNNIESDDALSNRATYGIENYYYVFETMVDEIMKGIKGKEKKKYNPSGYWQLEGNKGPDLSSNLRPDTIFKQANKVFVIDSKMYQYGFTKEIGDLPNTSSMQKQFIYAAYVKNELERDAEVINIFILPYNKKLGKFANDSNIMKFNSENLAYIGKAYGDWINANNPKTYDYIFTFLIDFNYLLNNYNNNCDCIGKICAIINEQM